MTGDNFLHWIYDGKDPEGNIFQLRKKKTGLDI